MQNQFKNGWSIEEIEEVVQRNIPEELLYVPIWVTMDPPDCEWAQNICIRLSSHENFNVRGNAILGFGHLARTCAKLNKEEVKLIIARALKDEHEYVRGHAYNAADDIEMFLS
jgi:hypothetical protein